MRGIKIPQYEFALKMQGGAYARGEAYLRDTTVNDFTYSGEDYRRVLLICKN